MLSRTVRDTGGASKALATAIDEGLIDGPRLFQCGKAISQTGMEGLRDLIGWRGVDHFDLDAMLRLPHAGEYAAMVTFERSLDHPQQAAVDLSNRLGESQMASMLFFERLARS